MGKKKDGAANARMVTTMATAGGLFLLRKLITAVWTKATGRKPPTDLTDPKVTLPEVLAWSIGTGLIIESARFAITRATARRSATAAEDT